MQRRFLAFLCLLLAVLLTGCTGANSVSIVTPSSGVSVAAEDPEAQTPRIEPERTAYQPVVSPPLPTPVPEPEPMIPQAVEAPALSGFDLGFASASSQVLQTIRALTPEEPQPEPPQPDFDPYAVAPDLTPLDLYTRLSDTAPLTPETEDAPDVPEEPAPFLPGQTGPETNRLLCLAAGEEALVLSPEGLQSTIPLPASSQAALRAVILEGETLVLAFECSQEDGVRTWLDFYDLTDPSAPAFTGRAGLDGAFSDCRTDQAGRFFLTTYLSDPLPDALPARYRGDRAFSIPAQKVLIPESPEKACFTLGGLFEPDGSCAGWFAALGAEPTAYLLDGGQALVSWAGESQTEQTWPDGSYQAKQTTCRAQTGVALLNLEGHYWTLAGALTLEGRLDLAGYADSGSLCLAVGLSALRSTQYEDTERGWAIPAEETTLTGCRVYLFDRGLTPLSSLDLAQGDAELVGLYGNSLYYYTPADGLLRTAGLTDGGKPLAAPLAEVGSFADFAILFEGYALGLQPEDDPGGNQEVVLVNLSNPSHITRKTLAGCPLSAKARLLTGAVSETGSLAAILDGGRLLVVRASPLFGPSLLAVYAAPEPDGFLSGTTALTLLSWSDGYALLDPDTGELIAP